MARENDHHSSDEFVRECYSLFQVRTAFERFSEMFASLGGEEQMGRFIRACYMYRKAVNLRNSEPDISMALLCSAVESTHPSSTSLTFKDWLVRTRLDDLEGKSAAEIRIILNDSYQQYVNSESEREGAMYSFRRFLVEHCPPQLRRPPMRVVPTTPPDPSREATFEEGLGFIYSRFRSLFIHEGVPRIEVPPFDGHVVGYHLMDVHRNLVFSIDMQQVSEWFSQAVLESIWHWISSRSVANGSL